MKPLSKEKPIFEVGGFRTSTPRTFQLPKKCLWRVVTAAVGLFSFPLAWTGVIGLMWTALRLIRCCGKGHTPAGTELTWAGWGPSQAAVLWSLREAQPRRGRQVSTRGVAPRVMAPPGEFLLLLGAPGEARREQPAGMARLRRGAVEWRCPSGMGTLRKAAQQSDCCLWSSELTGQRRFRNWPF